MINAAKATQALETRGPDFQMTINDEFAAFGHRRLAIIDTSPAGNQPMQDERYWLVFNGEIYNFKILRSELETEGEQFFSHSDSEVLFKLLIRYREKAISKLQGDFAFAFYDTKNQTMLLARDRFGIKPLYVFRDDDKLIFASELKSIYAYGLLLEIDYDALSIFLQLNYIPAPLTIYKNISKIRPGHYLHVTRDEIKEECYYSLSTQKSEFEFSQAKILTRNLIDEAVRDQLISDVPLGSFLSGGVDSSVIAMLAKRHKPDLHTFSIGFKGSRFFDESEYSRQVAKYIGSDHTVFQFSEKQLLEQLHSTLDYLDEPFADSSAIAVNLLSRETRKHSTVALSGDGADELFGGYNKHKAWVLSLSGKGSWSHNVLPALSWLPGSRSGLLGNKVRQARRYAEGIKLDPINRYWLWASLATRNEAVSLLSSDAKDRLHIETEAKIRTLLLTPLMSDESLMAHLLTDLSMVLPDDMLTKVDRMSMAHGLEVRVPFLDYKVAEFAFSLPDNFKNDGVRNKIILKEAFKGDIPSKILDRPKKGFEVPLLKWLRKDLKKLIANELLSPEFVREQNIFDEKEVSKLTKRLHSMNPGDAHARVYALVCFQWWWKKYMSNQPIEL